MPRETSPELALAVPVRFLASGCSRTFTARRTHRLHRPYTTHLPSFPHPASTRRRVNSLRPQAKPTQVAGPLLSTSTSSLGTVNQPVPKGCKEGNVLRCSRLARSPFPLFHESPTRVVSQSRLTQFRATPPLSLLGLRTVIASTASSILRRCCSPAILQPHVENPTQGFDPFGKSKLIRGLLNVWQTGGYSAGWLNGGVCCRGSAHLIYVEFSFPYVISSQDSSNWCCNEGEC